MLGVDAIKKSGEELELFCPLDGEYKIAIDELNKQIDMFPKADIEGNELKGSHKKIYDVMCDGG